MIVGVYLADPGPMTCGNDITKVLEYWKTTGARFPVLQRVARKLLAGKYIFIITSESKVLSDIPLSVYPNKVVGRYALRTCLISSPNEHCLAGVCSHESKIHRSPHHAPAVCCQLPGVFTFYNPEMFSVL